MSSNLQRAWNRFLCIKTDSNGATTFDANCRRINSTSTADKEIVSVGGNYFTTQKGNIIDKFDRNCKKNQIV